VLYQAPDATLVVIPDASLLSSADNASLNQQVLAHCATAQSLFAILDVPGGAAPHHVTWQSAQITPFRTSLGTTSLDYGAAYFPFLQTGIVGDNDITYSNLAAATTTLAAALPGATQPPLQKLIAAIGSTGPGVFSPAQIEHGLRAASPDYLRLHELLLSRVNVLPPSGAVAGLYALVDSTRGVWHAPAGVTVGLVNVLDVTLRLTDTDQAFLNVDALTGKSINAIRLLPGYGVVVWGARTLDGNSQDWRYVNVRRTIIAIEQSIRGAMRGFVFEPNVATTWTSLVSLVSAYLTDLWQQGALVGPSPATAFSVTCGLGTTMTSVDIINGILRLTVQVAITHPAEFIVISLAQQMQTS
jgi:hypothetical protein